MSKRTFKPYGQMTTAELRAATKVFDTPFAALDRARPLTTRQKERHRRAKRRRG